MRRAAVLSLVGYALVVLVGLVIGLLPEPEPEPLLALSDRVLTRGLAEVQHSVDLDGVRPAIANSPGLRLWSTDRRATHARRSLRTAPLSGVGPGVRWVVVPYVLGEIRLGVARSGASIRVECAASTRPARLMARPVPQVVVERELRPTGQRFSELLLEVDANRCDGPLALVVESTGRGRLVVGTPFAVGAVDRLKRSVLAQVPRHGAVLLLLIGPGLAAWLIAGRSVDSRLAPLVIVITPTCLGLVCFFAFWWSASVGTCLVVAAQLVSLAVCLWAVVARKGRERLRRLPGSTRVALASWALVSLLVLAVVYAVDTGAGARNANSRFWPVTWSSDNQLPFMVAEALVEGRPLEKLLGQWHVSDRPPLQSGCFLLVRPFARWLVRADQPQRLSDLYTVVGVVLNTLWAFAVLVLARGVGLDRRFSASMVVVVGLTPFAVFNSCYVWPKMLAGALGLLALLPLVPALRSHVLGREREQVLERLPWVAALASVSLLGHGGVFFFYLALGPWVLLALGWPGWRTLARSLVVAMLLLAPWMLWQRLVDPPGNALVKAALAGTHGFDEPETGVLETAVGAYQELGLGGWLEHKRDSLVELVQGRRVPRGITEWASAQRWIGFFSIGRSFAPFFLLAAAALATAGLRRLRVTRLRHRGCPDVADPARRMLGIAIAGVLVSLLVQYETHVVHHSSYATLLLLVFASVISGVEALGLPAVLVVCWSMLSTTWVWLIMPLGVSGRLDPAAVALGALLLGAGLALAGAVAVAACARHLGGRGPASLIGSKPRGER